MSSTGNPLFGFITFMILYLQMKFDMKSSVHLVALIIILFTACQPIPKTVMVSGTITNSESDKVKIFNDYIESEVDIAEGTFTTQFDITEAAYFNLRIGRETTTFFLSPGQSIEIAIDAERFDESVTYSGQGSEASNYLAAKYLDNEKNGIKRDSLYKLDEEDFINRLDQNVELGKAYLEQYSDGLSKDFIALEKVDLEFAQKSYLLNYEPAHAYYAKIKDFEATEKINELI